MTAVSHAAVSHAKSARFALTVRFETLNSANMEIADNQGNNEPACARSAFCTTRQAAARIGLLHRTLQMWVENGACRAWTVSG